MCRTGKAARACVVLFGGVRLVCQSTQVLFHIVGTPLSRVPGSRASINFFSQIRVTSEFSQGLKN